jgi:hypothetical protein
MTTKPQALERAIACAAEIEKSARKLLASVTMLRDRLETGDFAGAFIAGAILETTIDGAARIAVPLAECLNLLNDQQELGK